MKPIRKFEEAIACKESRKLSDFGINSTMFWAYRKSQEAGCEFLNFDDVIWNYDVAPIVEACQEEGIERITISSTFSSLVENLSFFDELGCKILGMTFVPTASGARVPALVLSVPGNN